MKGSKGSNMQLKDIQKAFQDSVLNETDPSSFTTSSRMFIYQQAYLLRLREILQDHFSTLAKVMDEDLFYQLCGFYIRQHPSEHPNVNLYGHLFPLFLKSFPIKNMGFVSDLAQLDWAVHLCYAYPSEKPLSSSDLSHLTPQNFPNAVFSFLPHVSVLDLSWPIFDLWKNPENHNIHTFPQRQENQTLLIYQNERTPHVRPIEKTQGELITCLQEGIPLNEALEKINALTSDQISAYFSTWMSLGLLKEIRI